MGLARRSSRCRSGSFDRRMSESAQFAEAVGEEPDSLLLKKIFEEDSSSDFDDDEIDEGGKLLREDEVEGHLAHYTETLQDIAIAPENIVTEQLAGTPFES